jgi:hypothetical protein
VVELGAGRLKAELYKPRAIPRGPHGSMGVEVVGAGPGGLELGGIELAAEVHKPRAIPRGPHGSIGVEAVGVVPGLLELGGIVLAAEVHKLEVDSYYQGPIRCCLDDLERGVRTTPEHSH